MARRNFWLAAIALTVTLGFITWRYAVPPAVSTYRPHDTALRRSDLYLFRTSTSPRALIWLYGNDVAFWQAHQELAMRLTARGYDVAGFDVRHFFDALPVAGPRRDTVVADTIRVLLQHVRAEYRDTTLPVIIAGHSLGADLALWTATRVETPQLAGVLLLSPTTRSHLYATARDRAFLGEPTEAGSYAAADLVAHVPPGVPIVVFRGDRDTHSAGDTLLIRAIQTRAQPLDASYRRIPLAGHSLRSLTVAGPMIIRAVDDIISVWRGAPGTPPAPKSVPVPPST